MRWTLERLPNIKKVVDKYKIYERILARNLEKMRGSGSPCTSWTNVGITKIGLLNQTEIKCYCWSNMDGTNAQIGNPDKRHFLCMGTGFLRGYQKYGYCEEVISTPSPVTLSSGIVISGNRNSTFILSSTNLLEGTITSQRFQLDKFIEFDRFLCNDAIDATKNTVVYQYSLDDITWNDITVTPSTHPLGNKSGSITGLQRGDSIRFRVILRKSRVDAPSPKFNSLRFRYRTMLKLCDIDPAFDDIPIPAFLASREQQTREITQGEHGWTVKFPLRWWTMPDSGIYNDSIIKFLKGTFKDYIFVIKNLYEYTYGEDLKLLHYGFESDYIRDYTDLLGIVHLLD